LSIWSHRDGPVIVIGSSGIDIISHAVGSIQSGTSNPCEFRLSPGGVARNIAENLARLGTDVYLITAVGDDTQGHDLLEHTMQSGVNIDYSRIVPDKTTGSYLAILDPEGNLNLGMYDMRVVEALSTKHLHSCSGLFKEASMVAVDANLPPKALRTVFSLARKYNVPVAADPTSVGQAPKLARHLDRITLLTLNANEANALCPRDIRVRDREEVLEVARYLLSQDVDIVVVAMAEFGVVYASTKVSGHVPAVQTDILDPTGAGDALTAAVIFGLLNNIPLDETVRLGISAAALTLRSPGTVSEELTLERLYAQLR